MLRSRDLDDQSFEEIVASAIGRLPWLCPEWTDYNAHDPGITIIELMAWYKEMQQYHINRFTDDMKLKLLKLAGVRPYPARPSHCHVAAVQPQRRWPRLTRLETREGIVFELEDGISPDDAVMTACAVEGGRVSDMSELMGNARIAVQPFSFGGERTRLHIGFEKRPERISLWFETERQDVCPRNPFEDEQQAPRTIEWSWRGLGHAQPVSDGTHALSCDGSIDFAVPQQWPLSELEGRSLYWLTAELTDAGCEDEVRLMGISSRRCRAVQRETWARTDMLCAKGGAAESFSFDDALALVGSPTIFLRGGDGWRQVTDYTSGSSGGEAVIALDTTGAVQDGGENLMVAWSDPIHYGDLFFGSTGLPNMSIALGLGGARALTESLRVMCDTLDEDGVVRPELWRCVGDLYACGPRDRVFTYDADAECINFGDGRNGAVVPAGAAAVFVCSLQLSRCQGGNVPKGEMLFPDGTLALNTAAGGGCAQESASDAAERLQTMVSRSEKCVSAGDYERIARSTPGLRVGAVKAIPGYDSGEPSGRSGRPVVTVVAIPFSQRRHPAPDERFLAAIASRIEKRRPICTVVRVAPPRYVGIGVNVQIKAERWLERAQVEAALDSFLSVMDGHRQIGQSVLRNDIMAALQRVPGVLRVNRLELRALGPDSYRTSSGDLDLPPTAVPYIRSLELDVK